MRRSVELRPCDETETVMRETVVTYVCDRCGEKAVFDGDEISVGTRISELIDQGWLRVHVGGSPDSPGDFISTSQSQWYRDLCGSCISALGQFLKVKANPTETCTTWKEAPQSSVD